MAIRMGKVEAAAQMLADDWQITAEVFSVTSYAELEREAREISRANRYQPGKKPALSHVETLLPGKEPIIAASDYVRACPQLISSYVEARFVALGTDGFGRSDTRAGLRSYFEVNRQHIVIAALDTLLKEGRIKAKVVDEALSQYQINTDRPAPWLQ